MNGSLRQMSLVPVSGEGESPAWSSAWGSEHGHCSAEHSVPGVAALGGSLLLIDDGAAVLEVLKAVSAWVWLI